LFDDIQKDHCENLFNEHSTVYVRKLQIVAVEESRLDIQLLFGFDVIQGQNNFLNFIRRLGR